MRSADKAFVLIGAAALAILLVIGVATVVRFGSELSGGGSAGPMPTSPAPRPTTQPPSTPPTTKPPTSRPPTSRPPTNKPPTTQPPSKKPPTKKWKYNGYGLSDNRIYNVNLKGGAGSCATVKEPTLSDKALLKYLKQQVKCMTKELRPALAKYDVNLMEPRVKGYRKKVETACGTIRNSPAPAFYCGGDQTIYWDVRSDDGNQAYALARLGYVGLLAHEFGHHLQYSSSILGSAAEREYTTTKEKDLMRISRRVELQAQCFEGVYLSFMSDAIEFSDWDRRQILEWHSYTGDEDPPADRKPDHGTSQAQYDWLVWGLEGGNFADCNTWAAPTKEVK